MSYMYEYEVEKQRRSDQRAQAANERALREINSSGKQTPNGLVLVAGLLITFFILMFAFSNQGSGVDQTVPSPPAAETSRLYEIEPAEGLMIATQYVDLIDDVSGDSYDWVNLHRHWMAQAPTVTNPSQI